MPQWNHVAGSRIRGSGLMYWGFGIADLGFVECTFLINPTSQIRNPKSRDPEPFMF